jgi:hypothetical protein
VSRSRPSGWCLPTPPDETVAAVETALRIGSRHFDLTPEQFAAIDVPDTGVRGGQEPHDITRENVAMHIPEA